MAAPEIELAENRPGMIGDAETAQFWVMGKDEFAVSTAPNVGLDRLGDGGRGEKSGECVVGESGGPSPVADDHWKVAHLAPLKKPVYKRRQ